MARNLQEGERVADTRKARRSRCTTWTGPCSRPASSEPASSGREFGAGEFGAGEFGAGGAGEFGAGEFESEGYETETFEQGGSGRSEEREFLEVLGEVLNGSDGQARGRGAELVQASSREAELATQLLEVQSEAELDRFLGSLLSRAGSAARKFADSSTGQALGGILKKAAGEALPVIGRGVGGAIDPKYAGLGERVGRSAGALFGLELEGLSNEDREFEAAKAFVRFADNAVRHAASAPPGAPARAVATAAATTAARRHAPGLLPVLAGSGSPGSGSPGSPSPRRAGRWERRGGHVVIFGL